MKTPNPSRDDFEALLSFISVFSADNFNPVKGFVSYEGSMMRYAEYRAEVEDFYAVIMNNECWVDYDYDIQQSYAMLEDPLFIESADIDQIKSMLTYAQRGERFADGHWGDMISNGSILRILNRLKVLYDEMHG